MYHTSNAKEATMTKLLNNKRGLRIQVAVLTRAYLAKGGVIRVIPSTDRRISK